MLGNPTVIKSLVLGGPKVGKTQLINRFVYDQFSEQGQIKSGVNLHIKNWQFYGQLYELHILEGGQFDQKLDLSVLVEGVEIFIFVFDLTNIQSYDLISQVIDAIAQNKSTLRDATAIVLGNKCDISQRAISYEEGSALSKKVGQYLQVSAKTAQNVQEICESLWSSQKMLKIYHGGCNYSNYTSMSNQDFPLSKKEQELLQFQETMKKLNLSQNAAPMGIVKSSQQKPVDLTIKTIIVGQAQTGKSSIAQVFNGKNFLNQYIPTIGLDFVIQPVEWRNALIKVQVWDTAGISLFRSISRIYYRSMEIVFLVYDVTNQMTFLSTETFYHEILAQSSQPQKVQFVLIGNKCDLQDKRVISRQMGEQLSAKLGCAFFQISAKTGQYVDYSIFSTIQTFLLRKFKQ